MNIKNISDMSINPRNRVAYFTLIISSLSIFSLAIVTIINGDSKTPLLIFNTTLPVFASWIGTVLAFYFGRENFESANKQVQNIVTNLTPKTKGENSVDKIMITPYAMTTFKMKNNTIDNIKIGELKEQCKIYDVSRLPILNSQNQIRYMIHRSRMDSYLLNNDNNINLSLKDFLEFNNQMDNENDDSRRFIIISKYITIEEAQRKLQECKKCKDIFITATGKQDEEMLGWIPDVHLLEYLEV